MGREDVAKPSCCEFCGCTDAAPCAEDPSRSCCWANVEGTRCSVCAELYDCAVHHLGANPGASIEALCAAMFECSDFGCLLRGEDQGSPRLRAVAAFVLAEPRAQEDVEPVKAAPKRAAKRKRAKRVWPTRNEAAAPGMCDAIVLDGAGAVTMTCELPADHAGRPHRRGPETWGAYLPEDASPASIGDVAPVANANGGEDGARFMGLASPMPAVDVSPLEERDASAPPPPPRASAPPPEPGRCGAPCNAFGGSGPCVLLPGHGGEVHLSRALLRNLTFAGTSGIAREVLPHVQAARARDAGELLAAPLTEAVKRIGQLADRMREGLTLKEREILDRRVEPVQGEAPASPVPAADVSPARPEIIRCGAPLVEHGKDRKCSLLRLHAGAPHLSRVELDRLRALDREGVFGKRADGLTEAVRVEVRAAWDADDAAAAMWGDDEDRRPESRTDPAATTPPVPRVGREDRSGNSPHEQPADGTAGGRGTGAGPDPSHETVDAGAERGEGSDRGGGKSRAGFRIA